MLDGRRGQRSLRFWSLPFAHSVLNDGTSVGGSLSSERELSLIPAKPANLYRHDGSRQ